MAENKGSFLKVLGDAVQILAKFLPEKTYLYFPLIYTSLDWIIRRPEEWKKKLLSWEVWPDPNVLKVKSDDFVLTFFEANAELNQAFRNEIRQRDIPALRKAFNSLYPLLGLENPFLLALFDAEIEAGKFRQIPQIFENRVKEAKKDIDPITGRPESQEALIKIGEELAIFADHLFSRSEIRRSIEDILKNLLEKNDE